MPRNTPPWVAYRQAAAEIKQACQETIKAARDARQKALKLALNVRQEALAERRMGRSRGYIKKGRPPCPTTEAYLAICETDTETGIARKLKVTRQRVHQLERQFGLCQITPSRRKNTRVCPRCGGRKSYGVVLCRACSRQPVVERLCAYAPCGKLIRKPIYRFRGKEAYCSKSCRIRDWWAKKKATQRRGDKSTGCSQAADHPAGPKPSG